MQGRNKERRRRRKKRECDTAVKLRKILMELEVRRQLVWKGRDALEVG
jgi:hypothetical protein